MTKENQLRELFERGTGINQPHQHSRHTYQKLQKKYPIDQLYNPTLIREISHLIKEVPETINNYHKIYQALNQGTLKDKALKISLVLKENNPKAT